MRTQLYVVAAVASTHALRAPQARRRTALRAATLPLEDPNGIADARYRKGVKQVSTLGPASATRDMIEKLFVAGTDVFRLNLSHGAADKLEAARHISCLLYTSPSPRDVEESRMPSSA